MARFVIGDYYYATSPNGTAHATVVDKTKSSYADIPPTVEYEGVNYNVTDITGCFTDCTSLVTAPVIPEGVTNMTGCFYDCTSLVTAPVIPSTAIELISCFYNCEALTGDVYLLITSSIYRRFDSMFFNTRNRIVVHTYGSDVEEWIRNSFSYLQEPNVMFGQPIEITVLNTSFNGSGEYRVDMVLDCWDSGVITGMIPNGTLYDMNDNVIPFSTQLQSGIIGQPPPSSLRCYALIPTTNQVPSNNVNLTINTVTPSSTLMPVSIGIPSTATPTQINQEGETDLISPQIHASNVKFNPKYTTELGYNLGDMVGAISNSMTNAQTNVDGDVKHIVTHADNVMIDDTTTLQDWITGQYNNLT